MKPTKMQRKLQLNKKTLVNLDAPTMHHVQGGYEQSINRTNCPLCPTAQTCTCDKTACLSCFTDCVSNCSAVGACCAE